MKFRPSWKFWVNVVITLLNLLMFMFTGSIFIFDVSIVCCIFALLIWKIERLGFDFEQERLKRSFEKQKKEQEKDV